MTQFLGYAGSPLAADPRQPRPADQHDTDDEQGTNE